MTDETYAEYAARRPAVGFDDAGNVLVDGLPSGPALPPAVLEALGAMDAALACIEAHVPATTFAPRQRLRDAMGLLVTFAKPRELVLQITDEMERQIAERIVLDALDAGFSLTINNGGDEDELVLSTDLKAIGEAMATAGHDVITLHRGGERFGFIELIYGNGPDLIADYSTRAEVCAVLTEAEALAERFSACT